MAVTDGTVSKIGYFKYVQGDSSKQLQYVQITATDGSDSYVIKQGYVQPVSGLKVGATVNAGQVIGTYSKSLAPAYGAGITEHVHVQMEMNGSFVNPQNYIP